MSVHANCFPAKGIKFFNCIKCGTNGFNYANGVDICADCLDRNELCSICGKPFYNKKPNLTEGNTNIEEDIYSKKYNIYEILTLIPNIPKDSKFKCSLDNEIWYASKRQNSLVSKFNGDNQIEEYYDLKQILEATYTIVKPIEEVKEKWIEIETHKDLCTSIVNKKMIRFDDDIINPSKEFNDKQIETLFKAFARGIFKIEYLEE